VTDWTDEMEETAPPGSPWWPPVPPPPAPPAGPSRPPFWRRGWVVAVMASIVGAFAVGFGLTATGAVGSSRPAAQAAPFPGPSTLPQPTDPYARVLPGLVVRQADVDPALSVTLIPGGEQVNGQTTLDLCNGRYPSESARTARLQVAVADAQGTVALSTEAVLYRNVASADQAQSELRTTVAHCPATPVVSPVGEATVTTRFNPSPDSSWPQVAGVQRLAYDFTTTDANGQPQRNVAVYLFRGRALLGLYFPAPEGPQAAIAGQTTLAGIVDVFAHRLMGLSADAVR